MAKTFDVVLKVIVHYCQLPNQNKSKELVVFLNAAIDTKMMAMLKRDYPEHFSTWPRTVEEVDETTYWGLQRLVQTFINDKHDGNITLIQFDDIYWRELNRRQPQSCGGKTSDRIHRGGEI